MSDYDDMYNTRLRSIDASLNRAGEGLRFLEDIARFILNNGALSQELKDIRHSLVCADLNHNRILLESRQADSDVGIDLQSGGQAEPYDLATAVVANSRRVQESLRSLEELVRLPDTGFLPDTHTLRHFRFQIYTIEKNLLGLMMRIEQRRRIRGLYVIIDTGMLNGRSHTEITRQVVEGGTSIIQLRDKVRSKREILATAREMKVICREGNALFLINDHLDIALAAETDGVHLGQSDLPMAEARRLLPLDAVLGCSVTTVEQLKAAEAAGADYIAAGGIFPTSTKPGVQVQGIGRLRELKQAASVPVVAISGINLDNIDQVLSAGADSAAVISAVLSAPSPGEAARQLAQRFTAR